MGNWKNRRIFRQRRAPRSPVYDTVPPPGLAIRKITTFNQALIGKWLWGSDGEGSYSWRRVVAAQCGELGAEWKDGVPLWEKKFCSLVGTIPWGKIVDTKNIMFCHKNILSWDDSAGEEALQNAEKRFWAKMNNFPCEISPPDPDIYTDEIDWNTKIDHELIKELDEVYFSSDEGEENSNLGFVIYFSTLCHDANQGQKLLNAAMDSLLTLPESAHPESSTTVHSENSAEEKPTVLWKALVCAFDLSTPSKRSRKTPNPNQDHFESISSTPMPDGNLNYNNILLATLKLFQKMYPLEEVFPETASPENPEDDNEFSLES
uniref:Uncharacterized protein n=1 Tax=Quercus lobata TaxID=97700 RepID=A0A7N2LEL3_QUELO